MKIIYCGDCGNLVLVNTGEDFDVCIDCEKKKRAKLILKQFFDLKGKEFTKSPKRLEMLVKIAQIKNEKIHIKLLEAMEKIEEEDKELKKCII